MSRFTFGNKGDGRNDGKKGFKASDMLKKKMLKGGNKAVGTSGYDGFNYQDMLKERMEDYKQTLMKEAGKRAPIQLPGVDENQKRELSRGAMDALEAMARRKLKKEMRAKKIKEQWTKSNEKKKKQGPINFMGADLGFGAMQQQQREQNSFYNNSARGRASWEDEQR